jgi:hypothetical protein
MSNIVAFNRRDKSARTGYISDAAAMIGPAATDTDGAAFAHAAQKCWLADDLRPFASWLITAVRSLGPELAAAEAGLPLPFVEGFARHLERSMQSLTGLPALALQPNLTPNGIEDTFYWLDPRA